MNAIERMFEEEKVIDPRVIINGRKSFVCEICNQWLPKVDLNKRSTNIIKCVDCQRSKKKNSPPDTMTKRRNVKGRKISQENLQKEVLKIMIEKNVPVGVA